MKTGEFLCRDDSERRRMTDLARNMRPGTPSILGVFMVAGVSGVSVYGWLPLLPPAAAFSAYGVMWMLNTARRPRPELWSAIALFFALAMMALGQALGHGPRGYSLVIITMPVLLAALIFPKRVVIVATAFGIVLMSILLFVTDINEVSYSPPVAFITLFVLVSLAVTAYVIRSLDDASRRSAFVDELTGALNRAALTPKLAELTYQASITHEPVAVIIADIDHFKRINDEHGHAAGDAVLREIVHRLSTCLSATEPVYRLGGEEFVVLLPGLDSSAAHDVAQRMCRAIHDKPADGVTVTMSFGVATSRVREPFDFDAAFARADYALYAAKGGGRDRVETADDSGDVAPRPSRRWTRGPDRASERAANKARAPRHSERVVQSVAAIEHGPTATGWTLGGRGDATGNRTVTDQLEREFTIDLNRRLMVLSRPIVAGAALVIVASIPWFGAYTLIGPLVGVVPYYMLSWDAHRFRNPQAALVAGWLIFQTAIAVGFASADGAPLFALPLFVLLVPGGCAVFRSARVAGFAVLYTALLMTAVSFWLDTSRVLYNPSILLFPIALLCEAGYVGTIVGRSAVAFRGAGIVDELTGLLNRTALGTRLIELEAQTSTMPRQVAIVLGDLDHFKAINDAHGHSSGDAVLRVASERIQDALRSFDSAYRVGGEEFLLLLPDSDSEAAKQVAERLHEAVRSQPCGGQQVTISLGVAATMPGEPFVYGAVFERADDALYEAKHAGRDRVCVDDGRNALARRSFAAPSAARSA